jgi:hypothetical protein
MFAVASHNDWCYRWPRCPSKTRVCPKPCTSEARTAFRSPLGRVDISDWFGLPDTMR